MLNKDNIDKIVAELLHKILSYKDTPFLELWASITTVKEVVRGFIENSQSQEVLNDLDAIEVKIKENITKELIIKVMAEIINNSKKE